MGGGGGAPSSASTRTLVTAGQPLTPGSSNVATIDDVVLTKVFSIRISRRCSASSGSSPELAPRVMVPDEPSMATCSPEN